MNAHETTSPAPNVLTVDHYTSDKLTTIRNIVTATDTPIMVLYHTTEERSMLLSALQDTETYDGLERTFHRWNEQRIPVMLIHPRRMAFADFSKGGHTIAWFSAPANLAEYTQANGRLCRINQKHDVTIHHIIDTNHPDDKWGVRLKPEDTASNSETGSET